MIIIFILAILPICIYGEIVAKAEAQCLGAVSSVCARMSKETTELLSSYRTCIDFQAMMYAQSHEMKCLPLGELKNSSNWCIRYSSLGSKVTYQPLTSTRFEKEMNQAISGGGACKLKDVIESIMEMKHDASAWFKMFCICTEWKLREHLRSNDSCLDIPMLLDYVSHCHRTAEDICTQSIMPPAQDFRKSYREFLVQNSDTECCFNVCSTVTASESTPILRLSTLPTTSVVTSPVTTKITRGPTTQPTTVTTSAATTTITTDPCIEELDEFCISVTNATSDFLNVYLECMSLEKTNYENTHNSCPDANEVNRLSDNCLDQASREEPNCIVLYEQVKNNFNRKIDTLIRNGGACPAGFVIRKTRKAIRNALTDWFGKFCTCLNDAITKYFQNTNTCPEEAQLEPMVRDCHAVATEKTGNSILPGKRNFTDIYLHMLSQHRHNMLSSGGSGGSLSLL